MILCLLLVSCAAHRPPSAVSPETTPTPLATANPDAASLAAPSPDASAPPSKPTRVGTVRVIGHGQHFVLVEVPGGGVPTLPDGQLLRCVSSLADDAGVTATLRAGRERRRPYIVADVVNGEPHVGDSVFLERPGSSTTSDAAAPMVLPTATSGVLPIVLPGASPAPHTP